MKVLVTGGAGFIGKYTVEELARRGHEPVVFDRQKRPADHDVFLGDILDETAVHEAMAHVQGWIHLAGVLGTQETVNFPKAATETNILGGLNVLSGARQYGLPGVNIAVGNHWMSNTYSISKSTVERFCEMYRIEHGLPVTTVRALNAYGPRQSVAEPYGTSKVRKIMPAFVMRALHGQPIEIYGDGEQIMDMIHVADVARVLVTAFEHTAARGPVGEVISAGTGRATTVNEIAMCVLEAAAEAGATSAQDWLVHLPMRPGEPEKSTVLGEPETLRLIGMNPDELVKLEDGVAETVSWYREKISLSEQL